MLECKIGCLGPQRGRLLWVRGKMVLGKIVPGKMVPEKWSPRKMVPEKWSPGKMVPEKNGPRKNSPQENGPGKMVPGKLVPGKNPSKIVPHQKNARKFKRFFHFYRLIALHTQKDVWRLPQDSTYASNWRTLNESRKICCRVLGFHKLITSEHSTHTHTPRCSTLTPRFLFRTLDLFPSFRFVVEFWVYLDWSHPNIPHTHTTMLDAHPTIVCFWVSRGPIFRGSFFR